MLQETHADCSGLPVQPEEQRDLPLSCHTGLPVLRAFSQRQQTQLGWRCGLDSAAHEQQAALRADLSAEMSQGAGFHAAESALCGQQQGRCAEL